MYTLRKHGQAIVFVLLGVAALLVACPLLSRAAVVALLVLMVTYLVLTLVVVMLVGYVWRYIRPRINEKEVAAARCPDTIDLDHVEDLFKM